MCAEDRLRALEQIRTLIARQVDGVAVIPTLGARIDLQSILSKESPSVLIDRTEAHNEIATVATNSEEAAYQGTRYLRSMGHRRIVFAADAIERFSVSKVAGEACASVPSEQSPR